MEKPDTATTSRFDDSFIIRTIRDFFIGLLLIFIVELGVRYAMMLWNFETAQQERTQAAAENLAGDVRSIMLNRGGPVAARTIYPILQRDHAQMSLQIAIEPSDDTVKAVRGMMQSEPRGIPADWPDGTHHEARVGMVAEPFCIQCHSASKPGDTLGWVTVRNYRDSHVAQWLETVRLSGVFAMGNVIVDTIVLFFLLRLRMEPILSLRSVVSRLAKAGSDLSHRAPVRTEDEFGELAHDLNLFLDRLCHIIEDVGRVLTGIDKMAAQMETVSTGIDRQATRLAAELPGVGTDAVALEALLEGLEAISAQIGLDGAARARVTRMRADWQAARERASEARVNEEIRALDGSAGDMRRLEERMRGLAGEGQRLLARLGHESTLAQAATADPPDSPRAES